MNAFEHGCLGMGAAKQRLMLEGEYDDLVMAAEADEQKQISLTLSLLSRQGRLQAWLEVVDPGPGFDHEQRMHQCRSAAVPCGRGFMMMRRWVDLVRRNSAGNRVVLMQMFGGFESAGTL